MGKLLLVVWISLASTLSAAAFAARPPVPVTDTIMAWGANSSGQLGNGTANYGANPVPTQVSGLADVSIIRSGGEHNLAMKTDGTVWAWGWNLYGQLGDGTTMNQLTPVPVNGLAGVIGLAAGERHSLAIKADGSVWAWGSNVTGQLGNGTTTADAGPVPIPVNGLNNIIAVAAGVSHSLALKSDGTVWAWGYGQFANGTGIQLIPQQVSGLSGVTAIAAGESHSLALKSDGTVWAWGSNFYGQLGDGTTINSFTPVQVYGLVGVTAIATTWVHNLALSSDGTVWAWGRNIAGELGNGMYSQAPNSTPSQVNSIANVTAIAAGSNHSLAVKTNGTVWTWGGNASGALGNCTPGPNPMQAIGLSSVTAIAAGYAHSLAIGNYDTTSNCAPIAYAYSTQTVTEGAAVQLTGSSYDREGTTVSYAWKQTAGPTVRISGTNKATATFTAPQVNADTILTFELTVTDRAGAKGFATTNITIKNSI